jgi:hypothetical protein
MNSLRNALLTAIIFLALKAGAQQTGKIDTDRPDQTESAFIIPKRFFQGELGFNKENYSNGNYKLLHPTSLFKYGMSDRAELRLEIQYATEYLHLIPNTKTLTYLEPVELGTKIRLWEEKGLRPKTSLIAHVGLPFLASEPFHSDPANFSFRFSMQHSLAEGVSLGYNLGMEGGGGEESSFLYTFAPGFDLGERWYAYAEIYGFLNKKSAQHSVDGGIAYYISNNTKIDFSGGFGLSGAEPKNYLAIGFSFRFPVSSTR